MIPAILGNTPVSGSAKGSEVVESRWEEVLLGARLADMREAQYRNTLALASLLELLESRGIVDRQEFARIAQRLDQQAVQPATGRP